MKPRKKEEPPSLLVNPNTLTLKINEIEFASQKCFAGVNLFLIITPFEFSHNSTKFSQKKSIRHRATAISRIVKEILKETEEIFNTIEKLEFEELQIQFSVNKDISSLKNLITLVLETALNLIWEVKLKICIELLGIPVDRFVKEEVHESQSFKPFKIIKGFDEKTLNEMEIEVIAGMAPKNVEIKYSIDISQKSGGENEMFIEKFIVSTAFCEVIDVTGYKYVVENIKPASTGFSCPSRDKKPKKEMKKIYLSPRLNDLESNNRTISIVFKTQNAFAQFQVLGRKCGISEVKNKVSSGLSLVHGSQKHSEYLSFPHKPKNRIEDFDLGEFSEDSMFNYMKFKDVEKIFIQHGIYDRWIKDHFKLIREQCREEVGRLHLLMKNWNISIRRKFPRKTKSLKAIERELWEANKSRNFFQKTPYLWSYRDIQDWSSLVFVFVDEMMKKTITLNQVLSPFLKKMTSKREANSGTPLLSNSSTSINAKSDAKRTDDRTPMEVVKEIIFSDDNEDFAKFENDCRILEGNDELTKSDLLIFLLYPKLKMHCQRIVPVMDDLLSLAVNRGNDLTDEIKEFKDRVDCQGEKQISNVIVRKLFLKKLDEIKTRGDVRFIAGQIQYHIMKQLKKNLEKQFCDVDSQVRMLFEDTEGIDSETGDEIVKVTAKLNCSVVIDEAYEFMKWAKLVDFVSPFLLFHVGVILQSIKLDWVDDSHVRFKSIRSKNSVASFDIGDFYIDSKGIPKFIEFIFTYNKDVKYVALKSNCQHFSMKLIQFMKKNFPCSDDRSIKNILEGDPQNWIDEMKVVGKNKVVQKIVLSRQFQESFPEIYRKYSKKDRIGGKGELCFTSHFDVSEFMDNFHEKEKFEELKLKFEPMLRLVKSFCRGWVLKERHIEHIFNGCFFNTIGSSGTNKLGLIL